MTRLKSLVKEPPQVVLIYFSKEFRFVQNAVNRDGIFGFQSLVYPIDYICLLYTSPSPRDRG